MLEQQDDYSVAPAEIPAESDIGEKEGGAETFKCEKCVKIKDNVTGGRVL